MIMDYRSFLQSEPSVLTLPYFEGNTVCDDRRVYRLREKIASGWYTFQIRGRYAEPTGSAEPNSDDWQLKAVSGYLTNRHLVSNDQQVRLFGLPPDEDLPRFAPIQAWRWFDRHCFFGHQDFESEVEMAVREAYEDESPITAIKGVTPALAQAFSLESTERILTRERKEQARIAADVREQREALRAWETSLAGRLTLALSHTGAELIDWHQASQDRVIVRYRLLRRRFECIVDTANLQVLDAGICLEGTHSELNLSSLPSAVHEAMHTGELYVFRDA